MLSMIVGDNMSKVDMRIQNALLLYTTSTSSTQVSTMVRERESIIQE